MLKIGAARIAEIDEQCSGLRAELDQARQEIATLAAKWARIIVKLEELGAYRSILSEDVTSAPSAPAAQPKSDKPARAQPSEGQPRARAGQSDRSTLGERAVAVIRAQHPRAVSLSEMVATMAESMSEAPNRESVTKALVKARKKGEVAWTGKAWTLPSQAGQSSSVERAKRLDKA